MIALEFVLGALMAFRLTVLLQSDGITERWREAFYDRHPYDADRQIKISVWDPDRRCVELVAREITPRVSFWGQLLHCPWCLGWWVSVMVWALLWARAPLPLPLLWPWAMSAVVGILVEVVSS